MVVWDDINAVDGRDSATADKASSDAEVANDSDKDEEAGALARKAAALAPTAGALASPSSPPVFNSINPDEEGEKEEAEELRLFRHSDSSISAAILPSGKLFVLVMSSTRID